MTPWPDGGWGRSSACLYPNPGFTVSDSWINKLMMMIVISLLLLSFLDECHPEVPGITVTLGNIVLIMIIIFTIIVIKSLFVVFNESRIPEVKSLLSSHRPDVFSFCLYSYFSFTLLGIYLASFRMDILYKSSVELIALGKFSVTSISRFL